MKSTHVSGSFLITCFIIFSNPAVLKPQICTSCKRSATLGQTSLNDPMKIIPAETYRSSVLSRIAEMTTGPCFHITGTDVDIYTGNNRKNDPSSVAGYGSERRIPEYSFESVFVSGLNETNSEGRPVRSKWTISLYFEGSQRELVYSWQTLGTQEKRPSSPTERNTGTTFAGHGSMMTKQFQEGPEIMEIIRRFEKRPTECTITPEKENINVNEEIEIKISGFRDENGDKSREFNRIIVHSDNGEIKNGEKCDIGPDYKVFTVKDGIIRAKYKAPDKTGSDVIRVYSACEVLPENRVPYTKTTTDKKIGEKNISIGSYDAMLILTASKHRTKSIALSKSYDPTPGKDCHYKSESNQEISETIEATVRITLSTTDLANVTTKDNLYVNQKAIGFTPVSAEVTSYNFNYNETSHSWQETTGSVCKNSGYESDRHVKKTIEGEPFVKFVPLAHSVTVIFDPKTGKALKLGYDNSFDVVFKYNETNNMTGRSWPPDKPDKPYSKTELKETSFGMDPVGEPVPDPYPPAISYNPVLDSLANLKNKFKGIISDEMLGMLNEMQKAETGGKPSSKIKPDLIVTKGNGYTDFGGEGRRTAEKKLEGGYEKEEMTFSWHIILKRNEPGK